MQTAESVTLTGAYHRTRTGLRQPTSRRNVMVNGIYSVTFVGPTQSSGMGVCYVDNGTMRGGDAGWAYFGTYQTAEGKVNASIRIFQHNPGAASVFGPAPKDFTLELNGAVEGDRFQLGGSIPGQPQMTLNVRGRKVREL